MLTRLGYVVDTLEEDEAVRVVEQGIYAWP
jgi:hypothetical protein